ncbi:unnamed protein product, partial [Iphiclides podalirius]
MHSTLSIISRRNLNNTSTPTNQNKQRKRSEAKQLEQGGTGAGPAQRGLWERPLSWRLRCNEPQKHDKTNRVLTDERPQRRGIHVTVYFVQEVNKSTIDIIKERLQDTATRYKLAHTKVGPVLELASGLLSPHNGLGSARIALHRARAAEQKLHADG